MLHVTFLELSIVIVLQVGTKTGNLGQGKRVEAWKAVSLAVEPLAIWKVTSIQTPRNRYGNSVLRQDFIRFTNQNEGITL